MRSIFGTWLRLTFLQGIDRKLWLSGAILLIAGAFLLSCRRKKDQVCAEKSGQILCGYCDEDALTSNNPQAGRCIYCPVGTTCSTSDPCDPNLRCVPIIPPDPPNTVTHNLRHDVDQRSLALYRGPAEDTCEWYGLHTQLEVFLMLSPSINFYILSSYEGRCEYVKGEIVNVGKVKGLAEVRGLPTSGWSRESAAQPGYGYIIRYKRADKYNDPRYRYYYARVYAVDYLTSATTGGILGVKVKYESPYNP